jgi:predicted 2-oxoglutarate/Fe(II)-dependent dioxygenase YbiX
MKQHIVLPGFITPDEVDALVVHAQEMKDDYRTHRGGDAYCTIQWINHDHPGFVALTAKLTEVVNEHNARRFHVPDLGPMLNQYQYTEYNEAGDAYGWHADSGKSADYLAARRLTVTITMTDASEHVGGGFDLSDHAGHSDDPNPGAVYESMLSLSDEDKVLLGQKGTLIIFPSNRIHRARPLQSGNRKVLVGWISAVKKEEQ